MTRILSILIVITLISCGLEQKDDKAETIDLKPFELTVTEWGGAMAGGLQYVLTEKDLKIVFKTELEGRTDKIIFTTELQPDEALKILSNLNIDSLKEYYDNWCISDGSQISVSLNKDNKTKTVHLSNFYHEDIGPAIRLINTLTPEEYEIWYDKEVLIREQKECDEQLKELEELK